MAIRPIGNTFLFAFTNETANGGFVAKNRGRIVITAHSQQDYMGMGEYARFGKVLAVGPDVKNFGIGDVVLIDKLKWTRGFDYDGVQIWKSDEDQVLGIARDEDVAVDYSYGV